MDAQEIYSVVEELSQLSNVCLCITSRISTIPSDCETLDIPTLSIEAAREAFYHIYKNSERLNLVDTILNQLDFHPLSITLLATVGHQNKWDTARLTREWEGRRTSVLQTQHNKSLAAAIEVSLTSPMFQELGPDAQGLLGVIAFFPQGVNENNLTWLFPAISDRANIFDKFCILSLTHRSNGFVTMLAPLRDYLSPKDPNSSPLLCSTKDRYFARMSVNIDPNEPNFVESQWITSEDVNVEHLLDVFIPIGTSSDGVWDACAYFLMHLYWHKKRLTILVPKIKGLPDGHDSKPECLVALSMLFHSVGNQAERKQLLTHALKLWRERGDDRSVTQALLQLSDTNRVMGLPKEGIQLVNEALEILQQVGDTTDQVECLIKLASLLLGDGQLDAAGQAASRAIDLLPEKGEQSFVYESHHVLGHIHESKGETEKAIYHFEVALGIASSLNWQEALFWIHYTLAGLFGGVGRLGDAHAHIEHAKSHAANSAYNLGLAAELQVKVWCAQHRFEEAKSEALRAADIFERLGAVRDLEFCRRHLRYIQQKLDSSAASGQSRINRESLRIVLFNSCVLTLHSKLRDPELHRALDMHPSASFPPHLALPSIP